MGGNNLRKSCSACMVAFSVSMLVSSFTILIIVKGKKKKFAASRLEFVWVVPLASLDHACGHNFVPEMLVFSQKFRTSSLFGSMITTYITLIRIALTICLEIQDFWQDAFGMH